MTRFYLCFINNFFITNFDCQSFSFCFLQARSRILTVSVFTSLVFKRLCIYKGNVSPIGVLNSVFETIHMGQLASKKEEQAKAKAKAEALDKGVTSSFDVLKSDPSLAYNFITSSIPAIKNQRLFFKEQRFK